VENAPLEVLVQFAWLSWLCFMGGRLSCWGQTLARKT
jgi:hypothetical protein